MSKHEHHDELVTVAVGAYMSVAPVAARVYETCRDDGYPKPSEAQMVSIMLEAMEAYSNS